MSRGNLVVGQSGGPTAVINSTLAGVVEAASGSTCIGRVYGMWHGIEGLLRDDLLDLGRAPGRTLHLLRQTPASALGSCRYKIQPHEYAAIVEVLHRHDIRYFLYIGGNGSADTSWRVQQAAEAVGYELAVIGLPKTIDNDLTETDHSPGYGSAARFLAQSVLDADHDSLCMRTFAPAYVLETMGRHTGWLAAATFAAREVVGRAPHLIFLPEVPTSLDEMLEAVERVLRRCGRVVVVLSEGVQGAGGTRVAETVIDADALGHQVLGGVGDVLRQAIGQQLGVRALYSKPGFLQRVASATVSATDAEEAYWVGREGVRLAAEGASGRMVVLRRLSSDPYRCELATAPLATVANVERGVPAEFYDREQHLPTPIFTRYLAPLLGGSLRATARFDFGSLRVADG